MRVLGSAVLTFEWIVFALAIPVAINVSGVSPGNAWITFGATSVLTVLALGLMKRPVGPWLGWMVQGVAISAGLIVPILGILGVIFAGLYYAAIRLGTRVDVAKAAVAAAPAAGGAGDPVDLRHRNETPVRGAKEEL